MERKKTRFPLTALIMSLVSGFLTGWIAAGAWSMSGAAVLFIALAVGITLVRLAFGGDIRECAAYGAALGIGWNVGFFIFQAVVIVRMGSSPF